MWAYMQSVIVSHKEALWLPYLLFLAMPYFAQLIYPFHLNTMKYLVTCTILQYTHIRSLSTLSPVVFFKT